MYTKKIRKINKLAIDNSSKSTLTQSVSYQLLFTVSKLHHVQISVRSRDLFCVLEMFGFRHCELLLLLLANLIVAGFFQGFCVGL